MCIYYYMPEAAAASARAVLAGLASTLTLQRAEAEVAIRK